MPSVSALRCLMCVGGWTAEDGRDRRKNQLQKLGKGEEAILSRWWSSATRRRKNERDGELGPQVQPPCVPAVLFACFVCVGGMSSFLCP